MAKTGDHLYTVDNVTCGTITNVLPGGAEIEDQNGNQFSIPHSNRGRTADEQQLYVLAVQKICTENPSTCFKNGYDVSYSQCFARSLGLTIPLIVPKIFNPYQFNPSNFRDTHRLSEQQFNVPKLVEPIGVIDANKSEFNLNAILEGGK